LVRDEFEQRTWQMFWLVAVENQPVATVADRFGVSSAAVRKAKSRILFRLKQEVGDIL
jgi:RNA polymerase sigma-70 factor (ECF subfamily)